MMINECNFLSRSGFLPYPEASLTCYSNNNCSHDHFPLNPSFSANTLSTQLSWTLLDGRTDGASLFFAFFQFLEDCCSQIENVSVDLVLRLQFHQNQGPWHMPRQWLTNWMPGIPQRGTWMPRINSWCQGGWGFQELNILTLYSSGSLSFRDHGSTLYVSCISLNSDFVVWHKHIQWIMTPLYTHLPSIFAITPTLQSFAMFLTLGSILWPI